MKAWVVSEFGGPDVLRLSDVDIRSPEPDEVVIRVAYCGICRHDLLTRAGSFPGIDLPVIPGHQVSGTIAQAGSDVTKFAVGDRVMTMIYTGCGLCTQCLAGNQGLCLTQRPLFLGEDHNGGYAEYVTVRADTILGTPDGVSLAQAAVVMCTLGTAWHALSGRGQVATGETVVITGATGGVGRHAVQIARHLGARVLAVTSRENNSSTLRHLGAEHVVVAPEGQFRHKVKELTNGAGADVAIEVVGAPTLAQSIHAVRNGGRVVLVGNVEGKPAEILPAHFILKEISLIGTKASTVVEVNDVLRHSASGSLSIDVDDVVPFDQAAQAHAQIESGQSQGRTVLEIAGEPSEGESA